MEGRHREEPVVRSAPSCLQGEEQMAICRFSGGKKVYFCPSEATPDLVDHLWMESPLLLDRAPPQHIVMSTVTFNGPGT